MGTDNSNRGFPFLILLLAVAALYGMSLLPWGKLTNNIIKDFNLLSDIMPADTVAMVVPECANVDPELLKEVLALVDQPVDSLPTDSATAVPADSVSDHTAVRLIEAFNPRVNGQMVIEDYTPSGSGLSRLAAALASPRQARIAVIGDSYIEGDIFTQDIRDQLQRAYGGRGVGYVPAHSMVAGFRRTVSINDSGWSQHGIQGSNGGRYPNIAGEYFIASGPARIEYKGNPKNDKLASWSSSRILFVAPKDGTITLKNDNETIEIDVTASPSVQSLSLPGETTTFEINTNVPGLVYLGAWLDDNYGVDVDCMSMRGVSGVAHRKLNVDLAQQMRQYIDYDLIIVEYGINALTADQTNYNSYSDLMTKVVDRLRQCYPNADILMLGIGDRGHKVNGEMHSIPTAQYMVDAQRRAAQKAGCLFWDTREAMGGQDAIIDWRERRLVNGDYIHLNSDGGKVLATELVKSIQRELNE